MANERLEGLDALRLAAVYGVLLMHVIEQAMFSTHLPYLVPLKWSLQWPIPALFVVSGLLAGLAPRRGFVETLARRAQRLLIPFAFWVAVYVLLAYAVNREPIPPLVELAHGGGVYGSHLWFLFTLFLCVPFGRLLAEKRLALAVAVVGAFALGIKELLGWNSPIDYAFSTIYPFWNWLELYIVGVALALWLPARPPRTLGVGVGLAIPLAIATADSLGVYLTIGFWSGPGFVVLASAGVVLTLLAWLVRSVPRSLRALTPATLGVFVLHPAVIAGLNRVYPAGAGPLWLWFVVMTVLTTALCFGLTFAMARVPLLREVVQ